MVRKYIAFILILFGIIISARTIRAKYISTVLVTKKLNVITGEYKLTLNPNGGTIENQLFLEKVFSTGDIYGELPIPIKEGYEFQGWFSKENNGIQISENDVIEQNDITIYAQWKEKNIYKVNFYIETMQSNYGTIVVQKDLKLIPGTQKSWTIQELIELGVITKENTSENEPNLSNNELKNFWESSTEKIQVEEEQKTIDVYIKRKKAWLNLNAVYFDGVNYINQRICIEILKAKMI